MKNKTLTTILIVVLCVAILATIIIVVVGLKGKKQDRDYETLMSEATDLYESGDNEGARKLFEQGTELDPTRSTAWWGLANCYYTDGDTEAAIEVLYDATRSVKDTADRDELTAEMEKMEDTLRYDENNPKPAPDAGAEEGDTSAAPDRGDDPATPETPEDKPEEDPETEPPEEDPEQPEEDPEDPAEPEADVTGIKLNTKLLDNVLAMKHQDLVETYGVATATNTDLGVMVLYQRCKVSFFYGYSYDGLVDPNTMMPYDESFPSSVAIGGDAGLFSGAGSTLSMAQLALLFGTEPSCDFNEMDQVWSVSVPYGHVSLIFSSDKDGNVNPADYAWIYHLNG